MAYSSSQLPGKIRTHFILASFLAIKARDFLSTFCFDYFKIFLMTSYGLLSFQWISSESSDKKKKKREEERINHLKQDQLVDNLMLWHRRLAHANMRLVQNLASDELVRNLPKLSFERHFCDTCGLGSQGYFQTSKAYIVLNKETIRITEPLNVTFDESLLKPKSSHLVEGDRINEPIVQDLNRSPSLQVNVSDEGYPKSLKEARGHPIEQVIGELNERAFMCYEQEIYLRLANIMFPNGMLTHDGLEHAYMFVACVVLCLLVARCSQEHIEVDALDPWILALKQGEATIYADTSKDNTLTGSVTNQDVASRYLDVVYLTMPRGFDVPLPVAICSGIVNGFDVPLPVAVCSGIVNSSF
ncbi:retrotransposon protein [Tanacetum coccineum]